jgi:multicomponent Na+:H+ antiporter subunit G
MRAMHDALVWIGGGLVVMGVVFTLLGAVGVLRFPDLYTRIHAASLTDTGGASLVLLGLALISGLNAETLKLGLVWVFIMLTTPVAASALANAAYGSGHKPRIGTFRIMRAARPAETTVKEEYGGESK